MPWKYLQENKMRPSDYATHTFNDPEEAAYHAPRQERMKQITGHDQYNVEGISRINNPHIARLYQMDNPDTWKQEHQKYQESRQPSAPTYPGVTGIPGEQNRPRFQTGVSNIMRPQDRLSGIRPGPARNTGTSFLGAPRPTDRLSDNSFFHTYKRQGFRDSYRGLKLNRMARAAHRGGFVAPRDAKEFDLMWADAWGNPELARQLIQWQTTDPPDGMMEHSALRFREPRYRGDFFGSRELPSLLGTVFNRSLSYDASDPYFDPNAPKEVKDEDLISLARAEAKSRQRSEQGGPSGTEIFNRIAIPAGGAATLWHGIRKMDPKALGHLARKTQKVIHSVTRTPWLQHLGKLTQSRFVAVGKKAAWKLALAYYTGLIGRAILESGMAEQEKAHHYARKAERDLIDYVMDKDQHVENRRAQAEGRKARTLPRDAKAHSRAYMRSLPGGKAASVGAAQRRAATAISRLEEKGYKRRDDLAGQGGILVEAPGGSIKQVIPVGGGLKVKRGKQGSNVWKRLRGGSDRFSIEEGEGKYVLTDWKPASKRRK